MSINFRMLPLGDTAFTVEYSGIKGVAGSVQVLQLKRRIEAELLTGRLHGIVDMISASRSLTVCIDPTVAEYGRVRDAVFRLVNMRSDNSIELGRHWALPVCYDEAFSLDLDYVAHETNQCADEVIQQHSSQVYDVLLVGFLPGFPFLSNLPERLNLPRRSNPRLRVPAGSVAIANEQTAIYPWESPGGWHLIGGCPVTLFNVNREEPNLLSVGDKVTFTPIDKQEYFSIRSDLASGHLCISNYCIDGA